MALKDGTALATRPQQLRFRALRLIVARFSMDDLTPASHPCGLEPEENRERRQTSSTRGLAARVPAAVRTPNVR